MTPAAGSPGAGGRLSSPGDGFLAGKVATQTGQKESTEPEQNYSQLKQQTPCAL